jgi:hypothetical protein
VLAFVRQAVVGDAEKSLDGDLDADFFEASRMAQVSSGSK